VAPVPFRACVIQVGQQSIETWVCGTGQLRTPEFCGDAETQELGSGH
jgi:hypothetical protein